MARLAHHVFFTLKDRSEAGVQHLISEAKKYLTDHDGVTDFDLGVRDKELDRPVNADFDVSLHMVFADRPAHDKYQVSERHQAFIAENKETWAGVTIFDSTVL
ncbi:Dabb family protein [Rubripirellula lacrimiformis]|nr:Dabb family protein [Rubripirellula lacrimiformis]